MILKCNKCHKKVSDDESNESFRKYRQLLCGEHIKELVNCGITDKVVEK